MKTASFLLQKTPSPVSVMSETYNNNYKKPANLLLLLRNSGDKTYIPFLLIVTNNCT